MLVVDASAVVELLLRRPDRRGIERRIADHAFALHAPHLLDVEVLSALRRIVAAGDASPGRADEAIADLLDLPLSAIPMTSWPPGSGRSGATSASEAAYLALAEALQTAARRC